MTARLDVRPEAHEYAEYYGRYISKIPAGNLLETLRRQHDETMTLLAGVSDANGGTRYEPGKWSIKEVLGHIIDTERIFAYRALRFARRDATPLPGYEQDDFVREGGFDARPMASLLAELGAVRASSLALLESFTDEQLSHMGTASGFPLSVRAAVHIIAGHERHHQAILRASYLPLLCAGHPRSGCAGRSPEYRRCSCRWRLR